MEEDFLGVEYASKNSIPAHLLPRSRHAQAITKSKRSADVNFIDATFFPALANEDKSEDQGHHESRESTTNVKEVDDDFFTEAIKNNTVEKPMEIDLKQVEMMIDRSSSSIDGIKKLWQLIDPVWKFNDDEILSYLEERVIYESEDVIAFDKPYLLGFTGRKKTSESKLITLFEELKKRVAPSAECLRPISRLEKFASGVIVFAKTTERAKKAANLIAEDMGIFSYRAIVKNHPTEPISRINIPLIKIERNGDHKLCPLMGNASPRYQLYHETTDVRLINDNNRLKVSLVDAFCKRSVASVVRSHLYYGINCPVLGDRKYMRLENESSSTFSQLPRISSEAMSALQLQKPNDVRQLPLFLHLSEVHLPETSNGRFTIIRANYPKHFSYALKCLNLLRK